MPAECPQDLRQNSARGSKALTFVQNRSAQDVQNSGCVGRGVRGVKGLPRAKSRFPRCLLTDTKRQAENQSRYLVFVLGTLLACLRYSAGFSMMALPERFAGPDLGKSQTHYCEYTYCAFSSQFLCRIQSNVTRFVCDLKLLAQNRNHATHPDRGSLIYSDTTRPPGNQIPFSKLERAFLVHLGGVNQVLLPHAIARRGQGRPVST